ncbi:MAG: MFS transporter [Bryobacteraceae bacterium]
MNFTSANSYSQPRQFAANSKPSHIRWIVVGFLGVIAALTYIDRLNLGIVAHSVQQEYRFNTQTMGWILGGFSLGYAIFHVPGGWLGDRFGARTILALAVLWWSVFTVLTSVAPKIPVLQYLGAAWSFAVVRFSLGMGEAAAMPLGNKMMAYWLNEKERALGTSLFLAGVGAGGIFAPFFVAWIAGHWGWRTSFLTTGVIGIVVAVASHAFLRNTPEEHSGVNAAELTLIRGSVSSHLRTSETVKRRVPWLLLLSSRSVWGLMISHFCLVYPVYIFFTWFFIYLVKVRGLAIPKASFWTATPFVANLILVPLWGWLSDTAAEKLGKHRGRQTTVWLGVICSAAFMWSGIHTSNNTWALVQLSAAAGFNFAASAVLWATCNDVTAHFSGSVSGLMTTFGSLGGWLSPVLTAVLVTKFGWLTALDFAALLTIVSGVAWLLVEPDRRIEMALSNEKSSIAQ